MDAKASHEEGGGSKMKKKPDSWKLPKIPVDQVYKKKPFRIFPNLHQKKHSPSYVIKEFEKTITLDSNSQGKSFGLVDKDFMDGLQKEQPDYVHWGLVQVAIKPLTRDGLEAPIIVCLRDDRVLYFKDSLFAMVETDLFDGPFYFNCLPSFSYPYKEMFNRSSLITLNVKTSGIPFALTYRIVCKAMVNIQSSEFLKIPTWGKTTYFQGNSYIPKTTEWDEVQVPKEWTTT